MATSKSPSVYDEVVDITQTYFGPAARRFVDRQIQSHLEKEPKNLRRQDLADLIDWLSLAMATLIEDKQLINSYHLELKKLAS